MKKSILSNTKSVLEGKDFAMPGLNNMDMLSLVSDAIISITDEDIIFFWNRSAQNIFGWKENEAIGKKLSSMAVPLSGWLKKQNSKKKHNREKSSMELKRPGQQKMAILLI